MSASLVYNLLDLDQLPSSPLLSSTDCQHWLTEWLDQGRREAWSGWDLSRLLDSKGGLNNEQHIGNISITSLSKHNGSQSKLGLSQNQNTTNILKEKIFQRRSCDLIFTFSSVVYRIEFVTCLTIALGNTKFEVLSPSDTDESIINYFYQENI